MNIKISKTDILRAIKLASSVADRTSTMPMLARVVIRAKDKSVTLSSTDLSVSVSATVTAEVTSPGAVALDAKSLADALASMPAEPITITVGANHHAELKSGRVTLRLVGLPDRDFPKLPTAPDDTFDVSAAALISAIDRVFHANRQSVPNSPTGAGNHELGQKKHPAGKSLPRFDWLSRTQRSFI